jgi:hypothetical protein
MLDVNTLLGNRPKKCLDKINVAHEITNDQGELI